MIVTEEVSDVGVYNGGDEDNEGEIAGDAAI